MNSPPKLESLPKTTSFAAIGITAIITIAFTLGSFFGSSALKPLDFFFYDQFMGLTAKDSREQDPTAQNLVTQNLVTIVDIDETSLSAVGQWPWPRYRLARLLSRISKDHPKAIGLDILFPEPDRSSIKQITDQFQEDFNLAIDFTNVPVPLRDNDKFFAHILEQTRTVGARYFYFDHTSQGAVCRQSAVTILDPDKLLSLHNAQGILCNTQSIETRLGFSGFINNQFDSDGLLRQTPLLIQYQEEIHPHLSLAVFMKSMGITKALVEKGPMGPNIIVGSYKIPVNREGLVSIRFNGPSRSHKYISAVDILNQNFSPGDIRDKIILIGSSAMGLNDIHHTIFDPYFPGTEVSAVIMDNIKTDGFILNPRWAAQLISIVCIATGLFLTLFFFHVSSPWLLFSAALTWMGLILGASLFSFNQWSLFFSPAAPLLLGIFLFSFLAIIRLAIEKRAAFIWYQQLADAQQLTMATMVSIVETRDPETGGHIVRTQFYAKAIAKHLKRKGLFPEILSDHFIKTLFLSVPLHDIGKVGVPDNILLKPGILTEEEFTRMKMHAVHGKAIIERAAEKIKGNNYLKMGAQIAGTHHEKWNGLGYPNGLCGEEIPLAGRIMTISDVYDALISKRCYKPAFSHETAMGIIHEENGQLFDPRLVNAFVEIEPKIKEIAAQFKDK